MNTRHIKDIVRISQGWVITLHSGAMIQCGPNLAEAIDKLDSYIWPQPELSVTMDLSKTQLLKVA